MKMHDLTNTFYHGSFDKLPVGTILTPRTNYINNWKHTDFYDPLETHRPTNMLAHHQAVFMVGTDEDIDLSGAATEWIFIVQPLGPVQRHDMNWSSEISSLIGLGHDVDSEEISFAAQNYWNGIPHVDEQVWEYLTSSAKILSVEAY